MTICHSLPVNTDTLALFEYLQCGSVNHIWLDNLVALLKRTNVEGMQEFLETMCHDHLLYLHLYEAAFQYQEDHEKFYSLAKLHINDTNAIRSILITLRHIFGKGEYHFDPLLPVKALELAIDCMEAEVERAGVFLAAVLLEKRDKNTIEFFERIIRGRPERPNITDFRRLCFISQLSLESGWFVEEMAVFKDKLPPRSKYAHFKIESAITLSDIIDEIPLYSGRHECAHECYHD